MSSRLSSEGTEVGQADSRWEDQTVAAKPLLERQVPHKTPKQRLSVSGNIRSGGVGRGGESRNNKEHDEDRKPCQAQAGLEREMQRCSSGCDT